METNVMPDFISSEKSYNEALSESARLAKLLEYDNTETIEELIEFTLTTLGAGGVNTNPAKEETMGIAPIRIQHANQSPVPGAEELLWVTLSEERKKGANPPVVRLLAAICNSVIILMRWSLKALGEPCSVDLTDHKNCSGEA